MVVDPILLANPSQQYGSLAWRGTCTDDTAHGSPEHGLWRQQNNAHCTECKDSKERVLVGLGWIYRSTCRNLSVLMDLILETYR